MRQLKISASITDRDSLTLDKYLNDVSREGMISAEQEVELTKRIREGDPVALNKMVRANLRFVVSVAKQYQGQGLPLVDLISEGNLGLIKAAERFDETRGFKFISYAVWWIRQSIMSSISEHARTVRIPLNQSNAIRKIKYASRVLEQNYERMPTADELAEHLEINPENVALSLQSGQRGLSLDAPINELDNDITMGDLISGDSMYDADELTNQQSLRLEMSRLLDTLDEQERMIIRQFFGLVAEQRSLSDLAEELSVSKERIRQIKNRALKKLSKSIKGDLKLYLN